MNINILSQSFYKRFEEKYVRIPESGCWIWTACCSSEGYGKIGVAGKSEYAHRVSWEIHNGEIPESIGHHGTCVLHRCDVPACVNPDHLFLGSIKDNIQDMISKNRNKPPCLGGDSHGMSKISKTTAIKIFTDTRFQTTLAQEYGLSQTTISKIKRREHWATKGYMV